MIMLVVNRPAFITGSLLSISFLCVLALIFSPLFGNGQNGLQYADNMFNRLSKGSSYFLPKVAKRSESLSGQPFSMTFRFADAAQADSIARIVTSCGGRVERLHESLSLEVELGSLLSAALRDAEVGYRNDEATLQARHGQSGRLVLAVWWQFLYQADKSLKQERRFVEAKIVHDVMKKAIEPAHNYYGIEAEHVSNMAVEMIGLLVFYVIYTMWWGYAIFFLFEGVGLVMKKKLSPPSKHLSNRSTL